METQEQHWMGQTRALGARGVPATCAKEQPCSPPALPTTVLRQFYSKEVPPLELSFIQATWSSSALKI